MGNAKRAHAVAAAAALALAVLAGTGADAKTFSCDGFAPTTTACTTGERTRVDVLAHDVSAEFNYLGTIESVLDWNGGKRTFRCTYVPSEDRTCISTGEFPDKGAGFEHRCRSIVPGSVIEPIPDVGVNGIEGGYGLWQCSVTV